MTAILQPRVLAAMDPGRAAIADVAVAPDGTRYAACYAQTLVIADWSGDAVRAQVQLEAAAAAVIFSPDGDRLACACADGKIRLFDAAGKRLPEELTAQHGGFYEIAWSGNGKWIAGGHYEPLVSLFDASGKASPKTLDPGIFSDEGRTSVAFSPDDATLASTAYNSILRWSLTGAKRKKLAVKEHAFFIDVAFAPDSSACAAIAETESRMALHVWDDEGSRKRGRVDLPGFSQRLAWSADSRWVAVIERAAPSLSLWNAQSLERSDVVVTGVDMPMSALAANPQRTAFIAGSEQGQLVIWEEQA